LGSVEGITGQVLAHGQAVAIRDLSDNPGASPVERISGERPAACIPLIAQNDTIGVLWVARSTPFNEIDLHKLTALADISASAIYRASLQEQTDQRLHRLAALRAVDEAISSSLDLSVTLGVLLDQVLWQLSVDAADVLLLNPRTTALECAAARGFLSGTSPRVRVRVGDGAAGKAALIRRNIHLSELSSNPENFPGYDFIEGEGFSSYFAVPLVARGEVKGVLEIYHRLSLQPDIDWYNFMEAIAKQAAIAIENAMLFENLQRSKEKIAQAYDATLEGWVRTLGLRDGETEGHTQRVTELTMMLAHAVGIDGAELEFIRRGALLHDIGKMGIPDHILRKTGPLTSEEREIIRMHPVYAYELLKPIPYLRSALDIPYCHHERWDGRGYPRRLLGEEIPLSARLFSVADVWDALISNRPYRSAWSKKRAVEYIRIHAGRQFDPRVVEIFLKICQSSSLPQ
jgi:putative nucleotidyltransferase with HDIG domain